MSNPYARPQLRGLPGLPLLVALVLTATSAIRAADPKPAHAPPALDLETCRQIGLEKQPALKAYRASADASVLKAKALDDLCLAPLVAHDIPMRRQQSSLGIHVAQLRVTQGEQETLAAVTRTYFLAVYARQQEELTENAVTNLRELRETVEEIVKDGLRKDVTTRDVDRINVFLLVVQGRSEEAKAGRQRALAALREAMGVGPDFPLEPAHKELPSTRLDLKRDQVVGLALANRPELAQAMDATQIAALEVEAQGKIRGPTAHTFAAGGDIHADALPHGVMNSEYRPGPVGLDMPIMLGGHQSARVEVARLLEVRAQAVAEKAHNLIALEAEDAFYRWQETSNKLIKIREAADAAEKLARTLRDDFKTAGAKVRLDDVIMAGIVATTVRADANETGHRYVILLSTLERVTGGALKIDYGPAKAP